MSITVKFFGDHGDEISARKFPNGSFFNVNVVPRGSAGIPSIGNLVRVDILAGTRNIFSAQQSTDFWGVANFLVPPVVNNSPAMVHVYCKYTIAGNESVDIPISIGSAPEPLPIAEEQSDYAWLLYPVLIGVALLAAFGGYKAGSVLKR